MLIFHSAWFLLATTFPFFNLPSWEPERIFQHFSGAGRYMLFLSEEPDHKEPYGMAERAANIAFALLGICAFLSGSMHNCAALSALGVSAFSIWDVSSNFVTWATIKGSGNEFKLKVNRQGNMKEIKERYFQLRGVINAINGMWSGLFLWCIMYTCARLSAGFYLMMKIDNYARVIVQIVELMTFAIAIVLSAESSRKVSSFNCIMKNQTIIFD